MAAFRAECRTAFDTCWNVITFGAGCLIAAHTNLHSTTVRADFRFTFVACNDMAAFRAECRTAFDACWDVITFGAGCRIAALTKHPAAVRAGCLPTLVTWIHVIAVGASRSEAFVAACYQAITDRADCLLASDA